MEKKLPMAKLPSITPMMIEKSRPIKPKPAPRVIKNFPGPFFSLPSNIPPIITDIPPRDAIKINTAKIA